MTIAIAWSFIRPTIVVARASAPKWHVVVVPTALVLILVLIFVAFRSLRQTCIIATGIPPALTGGIPRAATGRSDSAPEGSHVTTTDAATPGPA